jgi:hypothetical protein
MRNKEPTLGAPRITFGGATGERLMSFVSSVRCVVFVSCLKHIGGNPVKSESRSPKSIAWIAAAIVVVSFLLVTSAFANNPIPTVVGPVVPQAVVPGSGAFTLKVYGANFVSGSVVNWNRSPRSTTFISARELRAQILASDVAKPTAGYITVTNPPPGGGFSSSSYSLVEVHKPTKAIAVKTPDVLPSGPFYAITADVDGDGKLDLVTGVGSGPVTLNRGNGDGTFQPATTIGHGYFADAGIGFGDFNNDGKLDFLYGVGPCCDPPTHLKVLLGEGKDKFIGLPRFDLFSDSHPRGIVAGDFNGDGMLDVAVAHQGGNFGGGIFLRNGDGTFKHVQNFNPGGDMVGADFNGDGKLDLVAEYGTGLYLLLGNGDGTFQKPRRTATDKRFPGCGNGPSLVVSDFNSDGIADLAFCDWTGPVLRIGILIGNGDGTFQQPVYYQMPFGPGNTFPFTFAVGDFNSDGKTDLIAATAGISSPEFAILWGIGDGTFKKAKKIVLPKYFAAKLGFCRETSTPMACWISSQ